MPRDLPPSLAVTPNIPWEKQTLDELRCERDYWAEKVRTAPGFASAKAADDFRCSCEQWISRRERQIDAPDPARLDALDTFGLPDATA